MLTAELTAGAGRAPPGGRRSGLLSRVWRTYRDGHRRSVMSRYDAMMLRLVVGILLLVGLVKVLTLLL